MPPLAGGRAATAAAASAASGRRGAPPTGAVVPSAPIEAANSGVPAASPAPTTLSVVTFKQMKLLVSEDGKARDRDASLRLDTDGLHVMDGATPIQFAAYSDVIGLYQSHSREPRWATPDGTAVPVVKVGGKFSFFKGVPDWLTVRTRRGFIPLRVPEETLARVIAELEKRTGAKVVRMR
jgi:hypothetical protein